MNITMGHIDKVISSSNNKKFLNIYEPSDRISKYMKKSS